MKRAARVGGLVSLGLSTLVSLGCGLGKNNDFGLGSSGSSSSSATATNSGVSSSQAGDTTTTTTSQGPTSSGIPTGGLTTTSADGTLSSSNLGTESSPETQRDCAKIEWGDRLKEGAIVSRGDVSGYLDADGDGLVEEKPRDVGMCQMHLSGKKCGLAVYGRWG